MALKDKLENVAIVSGAFTFIGGVVLVYITPFILSLLAIAALLKYLGVL